MKSQRQKHKTYNVWIQSGKINKRLESSGNKTLKLETCVTKGWNKCKLKKHFVSEDIDYRGHWVLLLRKKKAEKSETEGQERVNIKIKGQKYCFWSVNVNTWC